MLAAQNTRPCRRRRPARLGAVLSMELVLVLPIAIGLVLAVVEFGLLWASGRAVKEAAAAGCRTASFRGADETAVRRAVERTLARSALIANYTLNVTNDPAATNEVAVTVAVPMKAAAPDLLRFLGFSLGDRRIVAQTVMRKE